MKDGGPAFPITIETRYGPETYSGMSLRDWFAGMALIHLASSAQKAYEIADAMLKERDKNEI